MNITIRAYGSADWDAICRIHDAARPGELLGSVDASAYLALANVWVAEPDGTPAGFIAASPAETSVGSSR